MTKTVADVMKLVKEKECTFVDFRFVDTKGKEQHTTVPISAFDEDKFESGHAFDGSSIAGWKGIEASDMLLKPDPTAAYSMKSQLWFSHVTLSSQLMVKVMTAIHVLLQNAQKRI
jgi:glutamine synthetase